MQLRFWRRSRGVGEPPGASGAPLLGGLPVDAGTLRLALTHKSFDESGRNNERLEFLGDAVLELIVTEHLFQTFPAYSEGSLTKARVHAVSEPALAEAALQLGLGAALRLGRGEESSGGRQRPSILSDAFEAVVAAVYLDLGLDAARQFVLHHLSDSLHSEVESRDFKSQLQELAQETLRKTPTYSIVEQTGPAHERRFVAQVRVGPDVKGQGEGRSKKEAEQAAARAALQEMLFCNAQPK